MEIYSRCAKPLFDSMHEECGVFGVYAEKSRDVAATTFYGLYALQHRGQESSGIAVSNQGKIDYYKNMGLVPDVFSMDTLERLQKGNVAIGHVRYSTTGASLLANAQPLVFTGKLGRIAIAHNGNIVNANTIRDGLIKENVVFQTSIDTEVIAALINKYSYSDLVEGIKNAAEQLVGSFALTIMSGDKLIAVRDNFGIRPLVLGKTQEDYIVASETCALDAVGAEYIRDVEPGEILVIDGKGLHSYYLSTRGRKTCIFEYVYFARPDSVIDGYSVYNARKESGKLLAQKFPVEADVVAGVPDSAVVAARGYSEESGIMYTEALAKNRYVGRTFIQPEQGGRESSVSVKMNALKGNVAGKRLVLLDDSIVRGTTMKKIVKQLRSAGAKEIHLRISSPIIQHPCYFGIDTQTYGELVGAKMNEKEMCKYLGADSLHFLSIDDLVDTVGGHREDYCLGCFSGKYPMPLLQKDIDKMRFE